MAKFALHLTYGAALTYLMFHRNPLGRAFHLTNPSCVHASEAMTFLRGQGYQFDEMPFADLRDKMLVSRDFGANALFAFQTVLEEMDEISLQLPTYDTAETRRELRGSGIACAPADEKLFGLYLSYLQDIGYMPLPQRMPVGRP